MMARKFRLFSGCGIMERIRGDVGGGGGGGGPTAAPENTQRAYVSGEPTAGQNANGNDGTWINGVDAFENGWILDGTPIPGALTSVLALTRAMMGLELEYSSRAINAVGASVSVSLPFGPIRAAPLFTTQPTIPATLTAGQAFGATSGAASGFPAPAITAVVQRQLGTSGAIDNATPGEVARSGYRYRSAPLAVNTVATTEAVSAWTAVVAAVADVAPGAGATLPTQNIQQNSGNKTIAVASMFTGNVTSYALPTPVAGLTIDGSTGIITIDTTGLALRTAESITVRANNGTAFLDRTFPLTVSAAAGTAPALTGGALTFDADRLVITLPTATGNPAPTVTLTALTRDGVNVLGEVVNGVIPDPLAGVYSATFTGSNGTLPNATATRTFTRVATAPGPVTLGTVTIATGVAPSSIIVTNVKLPLRRGAPLTGMRLRVNNVNYDYPATLGEHVISGLPSGPLTGVVLGMNAVGPSTVWSSPISFTAREPLSPPVAFSYEISPAVLYQGKPGLLILTAAGRNPKTYKITVQGVEYTNTTGEFDTSVFPAGNQTFTGSIENADGTLSVGGGFAIAPYVAPTVNIVMSPTSPTTGNNVTFTVTASQDTDVRVSYTLNGGAEVEMTAPYGLPLIQNGRYIVTASATDLYDEVASKSISFGVGVGVETFTDEFDGAAGVQLASRQGWSLASGSAATFVLDGSGAINMASTGAAIVLMEPVGFDNLRITAQISRPPSGGGAQAGIVFAYQDANNFCRLLIDQGAISVGRVVNGAAQVVVATYGNVFGGGAGTVRLLVVDWNANEFRFTIDGNRVAPVTGSETFSPVNAGFRGGYWGYGGGGGRTPFSQSINGLRSPLLESTDPGNPTNPQPVLDNITHNIADVYQISAPVSGSMRIRPYGATTGGTITTGTGSVSGVLPAAGAYHVALDTGSGYGTPVAVFAIKVPGGGQWYGRNCKSVSIAPMSNGSQISPVPEDGKKGIMYEPEPKMKQIAGGWWINGIMKNKVVTSTLGLPGHAFDSRRIYAGYIGPMEGFQLSQAHTTWPDEFSIGDVYEKVISIETGIALNNQNERNGLVSNLMGCCVQSRAPNPAVKEMAGQVFKGAGFSQDYIALPQYDSLLARIQALQLPCAAPQATIDAIYGKLIERGNWNYSLLRGGQFWKDSQEPYTPRKHTFPESSSNYYGYDLYELAAILLTSNAVSNAWKKDVFDALLFTGRHSDTPGFRARLSAGMGQFHETVNALKRLAEGRRFEDMTLPPEQGGQWGAKFASYFKWTTAMLPMIDRHTRNDWPAFSREREIVAIVPSAAGKTQFDMTWVRNITSGLGDTDGKQKFAGLELVRINGGQALPYDPSLDEANTSYRTVNGKVTIRRGVIGEFSTPLQVGEKVYMRIPQDKRPFDGMADWMYAAEERVIINSWAAYNPVPIAAYRDQARAWGFVALLRALGEIPRSSPYRPLLEYAIRTGYSDAPNNGWCNQYPGPHVPSVSWVSQYFSTNKAALDLEMADL